MEGGLKTGRQHWARMRRRLRNVDGMLGLLVFGGNLQGLPPGGKASEQLDVLAWEETPWKVGIRGLQTMERLDQDKFDHGLPSMRNRPARLGLCLGTSSTEHDSARPRWTGAFTLGHLASPGVQYAMPRNLAVVIAIASKQCALVLRTLQQGLPKPSCRRAASRFKQSVPGHVVERTQLDIHGCCCRIRGAASSDSEAKCFFD